MEEAPPREVPGLPMQQSYVLPFSGRTELALQEYTMAVRAWSQKVECDLADLAALLAIARDHHSVRKAFVVSDLCDFYRQTDISIKQSEGATSSTSHESQEIQRLYEAGGNLPGADEYPRRSLKADLIHSFPTYPFERQYHFPSKDLHLIPQLVHNGMPLLEAASPLEAVRSAVASILRLNPSKVKDDSNVFELGMSSLHSIDLARHLSRTLAKRLSASIVYRLMTIQAIADFLASQKPKGKPSLQEKAEQLVEEFSSPLVGTCREKVPTTDRCTATTVLLTGATGFVGSNLLEQLLQLSSVKVVCLIRGDPLPRLRKVFSQHALDDTILDRKLHSGSLQIVQTTDLSHEYLGCTPDAYSSLTASVDYVVHCAWRMDFNFPVDGFRGDLTTVRSIAQLCASCEKPATLFFASSFSTTMAYGSTVPEAPLPLDLKFSLYQGYAHSKLVAEHILSRLLVASPASFRLRILRIGQVCGHSKTGAWVDNELVPMLLSMLPDQRTMLGEMPDVSWIPSDVCARAICDLVVHETSKQDDQAKLTVHNLANPHIRSWKDVVVDSCDIIGCEVPEFVALPEFVDMLGDADSPMSGKRLLPYFSYTLEAGGLPSHYASLDVSQSAEISNSLKACPPVDITFLRILIGRLFPNMALPIRSTANVLATSPTVFMFGPWSSVHPGMALNTTVSGMVDEFTDMASTILSNKIPHRDHTAMLVRGSALHSQFITLATHIDAIQQLRGLGVNPVAVAGYCFGEFSAAVCRGFLTAREAVELISLRAYAIDHLTSCHTSADAKDCVGAACDAADVEVADRGITMLNVFAPADVVRKQLLRVPSSVPEIAIIVGPTHTVLSGSPEAIQSAEKYYLQEGTKVKTVETHIPFHSAEIEPAIALFTKLLPTLPGSSGSTEHSQISYVSGLTGRVLRMPSLGRSYWLRHMRQTFLFQNVVETISHTFGSSDEEVVVVDLGPGAAVSNMVKRVNCSNLKIVALPDVLVNTTGVAARPLVNGFARKSKPGLEARKTKANGVQNGHAKTQRPGPDKDVSMPKRISICLEVLSELRNHRDTEDVLYETISTLVDSIQFIRLTSMLKDELGVTFPPTAYASSAPIIELLGNLR
ncbi:hypothetical protein EIP86_009254 [Pleurotus ostreatoroseus]|nr:hypothetical protein EIP86_009254 [Pleurotus ostreatoroseus]